MHQVKVAPLGFQTQPESVCLAVQLIKFYGESDPKKLSMLERFTYDTDGFSHFDLVAELDASRDVPLTPLWRG